MPYDPDAWPSDFDDNADASSAGTATLTAPTGSDDAFDPDAEIAAYEAQQSAPAASSFDPDAEIAEYEAAKAYTPPPFDPDRAIAAYDAQQAALHSTSPTDPAPVSSVVPDVAHEELNAGRELVGGAAAGTLGIAEGYQRTMAGQDAATPDSVNAYLDKQIADRQQALSKLASSSAPDSDQATSALDLEIKRLQAKRDDHRLLSPGDAPGLSSKGLLDPQQQAARDQRVASAEDTANTLQSAKAQAGSFFGQDPALSNTVAARGFRAAGDAAPLLASSALPGGAGVAAGVAGLQAKATSYDDYLADAVKAGRVDAQGQPTADARQEAQDYSTAAALRTVPEMAAFLGTGKVAAGVVSKLLSPETPAAVRLLASAAGATAGNAVAGTANQVIEQAATGKPIDPSYSLERGVQDTLFGGLHAAGEMRAQGNINNAGAENPQLNASASTPADAIKLNPSETINSTAPETINPAAENNADNSQNAKDAQVISAVQTAASTADSIEQVAPLTAQALRQKAAQTVAANVDAPTAAPAAEETIAPPPTNNSVNVGVNSDAAAQPGFEAPSVDANTPLADANFDADEYLRQAELSDNPTDQPEAREPVPPIFAQGDTPAERSANYLDVDGEAMPTAVRFEPGEQLPASLADSPQVQTPDGATVVYDGDIHQPEDFAAPSADASDTTAQDSTATDADDQPTAQPNTPQAPLQPNTLVGQRALFTLQTLGRYQSEGKPMKPGDYANLRQAYRELQADIAAQRAAMPEAPSSPRPADEAPTQPPVEETPLRDINLDPDAEDKARREYEAELLGQAREGISSAGGVELLDALRQAGGLPTSDPVLSGELILQL